jgi:hypothetical protein
MSPIGMSVQRNQSLNFRKQVRIASAHQLADSNVVFCITTPSDDLAGARYMEVTDDATPQVVLKIEVTGQNAYRAVHMPSLYPGVQW